MHIDRLTAGERVNRLPIAKRCILLAEQAQISWSSATLEGAVSEVVLKLCPSSWEHPLVLIMGLFWTSFLCFLQLLV